MAIKIVKVTKKRIRRTKLQIEQDRRNAERQNSGSGRNASGQFSTNTPTPETGINGGTYRETTPAPEITPGIATSQETSPPGEVTHDTIFAPIDAPPPRKRKSRESAIVVDHTATAASIITMVETLGMMWAGEEARMNPAESALMLTGLPKVLETMPEGSLEKFERVAYPVMFGLGMATYGMRVMRVKKQEVRPQYEQTNIETNANQDSGGSTDSGQFGYSQTVFNQSG